VGSILKPTWYSFVFSLLSTMFCFFFLM
jgi:hypothetical protein